MTPRVYVTARVGDDVIARIRATCDTRVRPATSTPARAELLAGIEDAAGLLCSNSSPLDAAFFEAAPPTLRVIAQVGVGYDNVDLDAATRAGIAICNTPDVLTEAVADLTLGLIVTVARNMPAFSTYAKTGWGRTAAPSFGVDVHGKTLGIIGMGRIGRAVSRRAKAFGMRLLLHDLFTAAPAGVDAEYRSKDDLLREADFVTLHVDLNATTRGFISDGEFALMKPTAFLINTSRGPVVDQPALTRALIAQRIAGAALDVLAKEPPDADDPLLALDNAFILSHIGTATLETREAMVRLAVDNLLAGVSGQLPGCVVNTGVIAAWTARSA